MERQQLVEQLDKFGESDLSRNIKILIGKKAMEMTSYLEAANLRGLRVDPQKYYVFISDKGKVLECSTPQDAVDNALNNTAFDYNTVEIADYVDFGYYGRFYVCGENIDGTKFLVTKNPSHRAKRAGGEFYLQKNLAQEIIEKDNY